jgi:hypothetical protein
LPVPLNALARLETGKFERHGDAVVLRRYLPAWFISIF